MSLILRAFILSVGNILAAPAKSLSGGDEIGENCPMNQVRRWTDTNSCNDALVETLSERSMGSGSVVIRRMSVEIVFWGLGIS